MRLAMQSILLPTHCNGKSREQSAGCVYGERHRRLLDQTTGLPQVGPSGRGAGTEG